LGLSYSKFNTGIEAETFVFQKRRARISSSMQLKTLDFIADNGVILLQVFNGAYI
jgi:hypothetical protein